MYNPQQKKTKLLNGIYPRIDISEYVREFLFNVKKQGGALNANHASGAIHMKELLNNPAYTTFKSIRDFRDGFFYWNEQKVDYVPSNLGRGRGYLFYFICNGCGRRIKYLYECTPLDTPLCRICCCLGYKEPSRKARYLSRLLRKSYLSSEAKYMLIKRAGITREDIPDEI